MTEPPVLYKVKNKTALITFNRPHNRNSMDNETMSAFNETINRVKNDKQLRCLIITGSGNTFCAGADFKSSLLDDSGNLPHEHLLNTYMPFLKIDEIKIPVIAAMNGHAVGGGFGLALICDIRIASRDSKYGANFARLGIHSGMAISYMLPLNYDYGSYHIRNGLRGTRYGPPQFYCSIHSGIPLLHPGNQELNRRSYSFQFPLNLFLPNSLCRLLIQCPMFLWELYRGFPIHHPDADLHHLQVLNRIHYLF